MEVIMTERLAEFITHARDKGMDHATIRMLLLANGWRERDIIQAMTETSLDRPIPAPPDTGGAREAFLHLLAFASLYTAVIAAVVLVFNYIERWFPDPAFPVAALNARLSGMRWSVAVLLVAFPVFFWLSRFVLREIAATPEKSWSGIRRWLTYLTLFAAAIALGGDLITLVFYLLEGELSVRFVLKFLTVLVIAGMVFAYYVTALRLTPDRPESRHVHRIFGWSASVLVAVILVYGFAVTGSPLSERSRKFDDRRIDALKNIETEIGLICLGPNQYQPVAERTMIADLPPSLDEVARLARRRRPDIVDPETGARYRYEVTGESTFVLCASFNQVDDDPWEVRWNHPAGEHCFEFDLLRD
jgi:hypothetical protein